jgi:hypothetical protein
MAIDLEDIGSRYTTTATASFRRAPLGGFGVVPNYVPSSQIDALDAAWDDLTNGSHSKNNLEVKAPQVGFFQLVNVPKNLNDSFNTIWKAYTSWRDTQVDIVKNTAPGFAAQQTALGQAKSIYAQAVAAGAKPEAVAIAKVSKQTFTPEAVTAGTGAVLVALGLAFVLITWQPRRRSGGAMAGIERTPEQLSKAQKYVRKIRNANKQEYARAYLAHLTQDTPEPGRGKLGTMGAQAVRHQLKTIFEEEGFRGLSGAGIKKRRTVHLEFLTGHAFTRFRVQASAAPEKFGHPAEDGSWALPEKKHMDRFNQLLKSWQGHVTEEGGGSFEGLRRRHPGFSGIETTKYRVTSVDKYHGPDKETYEIALPASAFSSKKALGKALRAARVLMRGQTVRDFRGPTAWERGEPLPGRNRLTGESRPTPSPYAKSPIPESAVIVFPNNVPGLTTGYHSITLTPV